eukprot:Skav224325  [mRNA]  locus=scaffold1353:42774:70462:- [translate_table: standard]
MATVAALPALARHATAGAAQRAAGVPAQMSPAMRGTRIAGQVLAAAAGCLVASHLRASRSKQLRAVRCHAAAAEPETYPPAVIIGGGRLGEAFQKMGLGSDVIMRRGEPFPSEAPKGPIYVCTRNDALESVIASVPEDRHEDLIFVQNGVLMPFLEEKLKPGLPLTILLVYFAVAKKGEAPLDGKTDTDPDGLSAVNAGGKWAREVQWRLTSSRLTSCRPPRFEALLGVHLQQLRGTVGEVESKHRSEVDELVVQLATAVSSTQDVSWERRRLYALGDYLEMASMGSLGGAAYQILLQSKLIITALMMWGIKGSKQTALQWNILVLVMFSMCVYMLGGKSDSGGGGIPIAGVLNVLLKVTVSCLCAVLSDAYMKEFKDEWWDSPIYMQLVQFKCAWFATILLISFTDGQTWQNGFFNGWDTTTVGVLASFTVKGWSTMYLLAILDSVLKNIGEACAVLVIYAAQAGAHPGLRWAGEVLTDFISYEAYASKHPVTPPRVSLESLYWQPPVPLEQSSVPSRIRVAVVGSHATLSLEPVDMLRRCAHCPGVLRSGIPLDAEKDPYSFPWDVMKSQVDQIYAADAGLQEAELIICTEPMAGCLMMLHSARARGKVLPLLGYLGVALLNNCPPEDLDTFWQSLMELLESDQAQMAVNNLILSEQIYYQSGYRMPYVRAHGLYTNMAYAPTRGNEVLVWRAPLFSSMSCTVPAFLGAEWMYRLLYQRGQLSVGERMYQATMPGYDDFAAMDASPSDSGGVGFPPPSVGLSSAKAARGVAEDVLTRGMQAEDFETDAGTQGMELWGWDGL